ncbi:OmpA family protein [Candidatus Poribacteria bacterium]|nr:OmpA family protein [Candidatus Poribacteria bacterium]
MKKLSWLTVVVSIVLSIALISCGYVKKDEFEKQLSDHKMEVEQKIQLAQDAAAEASKKADANLATAREEIEKTQGETIAIAEEKDVETLAKAKENMAEGDQAVRKAAEEAASKALTDAKAAAMANDEKVKKAASEAADKAMGAAKEADRKAAMAAEEAEVAKMLPKPKEPTVFTVYFSLGQTKLSKEAIAEIEKAAEAIKSRPDDVVKIEGHTDNTPVIKSTRYMNNWGLSQARANVVKNHLVNKLGIAADRIDETIGVAFYEPKSTSNKMNRRAEVIIIPAD